jgi:hypothetical protein
MAHISIKYTIPFCLLLLCILSCKKEAPKYSMDCEVKYFSMADSYIATAYFIDPANSYNYPALSGNESITFNGRSSDYMNHHVYCWTGKGKINSTFTINRNKKQGTISIGENQLGNYKINCPDTAYRSKGFTAYVSGVTPDKKGKVYTYTAFKSGSSQTYLQGDSTVISKDVLQNYNEGAGFSIYASEIAQTNLFNTDIQVDAYLRYTTRFEKSVWLIK